MKKSCILCIVIFAFISQLNAASIISVTIGSACPYSVGLSWIGSATRGFNVYRATVLFGTKTFIGSVNGLTKSATDVSAQPGQTYYYYVEAVDDNSSYMSTIAATATVPDLLGKPIFPTATLVTSGINISWTYFDNEDGMYIYRSTNFGQYYLVKTITSPFTSSWVDYTVLPGNSYSYKISGYNKCGESEASIASLTITVPTLPDLVTDSLSITVQKDSLFCRFIVSNRGDKTAIIPFKVGALCNDILVADWQTNGNLLNGWYLTFIFKFKTKDSRNIITVCADYTNLIDEYSKTNNCLSDTVYATPGAILERPSLPPSRLQIIRMDGSRLFINSQGDFKLELFDLNGRNILRERGFGSKTIDLHSFAKGKYVVMLKSNKSISTEHILVK